MTSPVLPPQARPSRAGRNLPAAIAVGVALVALVVASLALAKVVFVGLVALAVLVALWELSTALSGAGIKVPVVPVALGGLALPASAYLAGARGLAAALALTALATLLWRLAGAADGYIRDAGAGVLCLVYLPLMGGFVVLLLRPEDGVWRVLTLIGVTIASDVGGYAVGALLGRHPIAPRISPKKSWEGFAGSLACCLAAGYLLVEHGLDGPWPVGLALGAAAAVAGTAGDFVESMIKRDVGIKDMGGLLPGHGGLMDRLDSLVATAVPTWLLLSAFVPVS